MTWIKADSNRTKQETFICPFCRERCYQAYKKQKAGQCTYRFCPNCGRMIRNEM